jgi:hypothetical protein
VPTKLSIALHIRSCLAHLPEHETDSTTPEVCGIASTISINSGFDFPNKVIARRMILAMPTAGRLGTALYLWSLRLHIGRWLVDGNGVRTWKTFFKRVVELFVNPAFFCG